MQRHLLDDGPEPPHAGLHLAAAHLGTFLAAPGAVAILCGVAEVVDEAVVDEPVSYTHLRAHETGAYP
eukprot:7159083-Pyramimonas_sp.AAC.1